MNQFHKTHPIKKNNTLFPWSFNNYSKKSRVTTICYIQNNRLHLFQNNVYNYYRPIQKTLQYFINPLYTWHTFIQDHNTFSRYYNNNTSITDTFRLISTSKRSKLSVRFDLIHIHDIHLFQNHNTFINYWSGNRWILLLFLSWNATCPVCFRYRRFRVNKW